MAPETAKMPRFIVSKMMCGETAGCCGDVLERAAGIEIEPRK